jgi:predicted AAA+ superfamily ATPase
MNIKRTITNRILDKLKNTPVVALLGPRQVGKTTLVKEIEPLLGLDTIYLDLESFADLNKLTDAEHYFLQRKDKLIIIDEVQRMPELFPLFRSVIDKDRRPSRFLLLGSASPEILARSSETLAGRIAYLEMHPFNLLETGNVYPKEQLWLRGGFPEMFLSRSDAESFEKRLDFIQTYIERELPLLGLKTTPAVTRNLLRMLTGIHGNLINYSMLANSLGIESNNIKRIIDLYEDAFLIRRLQPFHINISKRLVKTPKLFIRDSGLLHALAGIEDMEELEGYAGKGNSWEGFVIQQIIALLKPAISPYFYRTQDGVELDMILIKGNRPIVGIEVKYSNAPKITKGTTIASKDFEYLPIWIVTPGVEENYAINQNVSVTGLKGILAVLKDLGCLYV